jgi:hypothetical protein
MSNDDNDVSNAPPNPKPREASPFRDPAWGSVADLERTDTADPTKSANRLTFTVPTPENTVLSLGQKGDHDAGITGQTKSHVRWLTTDLKTVVSLGKKPEESAAQIASFVQPSFEDGYGMFTDGMATHHAKKNHVLASETGKITIHAKDGAGTAILTQADAGDVETIAKGSIFHRAETGGHVLSAAKTHYVTSRDAAFEQSHVFVVRSTTGSFEQKESFEVKSKTASFSHGESFKVESKTALLRQKESFVIEAAGCKLEMSKGKILLDNGAGSTILLYGGMTVINATMSLFAKSDHILHSAGKIASTTAAEISGTAGLIKWNG